MSAQPGRLLTEQEMREFRQPWPKLCRCGHPEAEHGAYPPHECLIHRQWRERRRGQCGCEGFVEMKA